MLDSIWKGQHILNGTTQTVWPDKIDKMRCFTDKLKFSSDIFKILQF